LQLHPSGGNGRQAIVSRPDVRVACIGINRYQKIGARKMKVGFIGLGNMGSAMAARLLQAGHTVTVFNRTPEKGQTLIAQGAQRAEHIEEACRGDVVITMLSNDEAVEQVVFQPNGLLATLGGGAVHVSSSTISPALSRRLARAHAQQQQSYVAAPVFGRPEAAAAGTLIVVAAGEALALEYARPLFEAMAKKTFLLGEMPDAANLVKLSGNFLFASVIESLGEAFALIRKSGLDVGQFLELIKSLFDVPAYKTYATLIAGGKFEPAAFSAPLGQKDIRLLLSAAEALVVPMPVASLLRDRLLRLMADGGERLDWAAIGGLASQDAGIAAQ
jgi:3-hydroxyisobutyrate dehydrogenase-like beta-hydroxyacid dehydrogenase